MRNVLKHVRSHGRQRASARFSYQPMNSVHRLMKSRKPTRPCQKNMISLSDHGRAQIQAFADAHNMTFSAAIESLALIGMNADLTALLVPLLCNPASAVVFSCSTSSFSLTSCSCTPRFSPIALLSNPSIICVLFTCPIFLTKQRTDASPLRPPSVRTKSTPSTDEPVTRFAAAQTRPSTKITSCSISS
jgi:hypothetical protein